MRTDVRFSVPWWRRARRVWHLPAASSARSTSTRSTFEAARSTCTTISCRQAKRRRAPLVAAGIARPDGAVRHRRRHPVNDAEWSLLYNGTEKGRTEIRRGNDYGAALVQKYPKQFGQMGGVPLPDLDGSLKEIEYVYDTLKVDAIGIYSNDNQRALAGRPVLRADVAGTEPPPRHRLHAPTGATVLQ